MKCSKCNCEVKEGSNFCENCGNKLENINNNSLNNVLCDNANLNKIKKFNKICSIFYFFVAFVIGVFFIKILFSEAAFFNLLIFGIFIVGGLFYLFNVGLINYINIKLLNIEEQKLVNGL